jgi:hypothetical protein
VASDKKSVSEIIGEFLRDVAILVLVFYPLDMKQLSLFDRELIVIASASLLSLGIMIERAGDGCDHLLAGDHGVWADSISRGDGVGAE